MVEITYDLNNKNHSIIINDYYWFSYYLDIVFNDIIKNPYIQNILNKDTLIWNTSEEDQLLFNKVINDCFTKYDFNKFIQLYYQNIVYDDDEIEITTIKKLLVISDIFMMGIKYIKRVYRNKLRDYFNKQNI